MTNKYQFIVFLQGYESEEAEKEAEKINEILPNENYYKCLIEYLSNWDYGEYTEDVISEEQFYHEIGTYSHVYKDHAINSSDYYALAYNESLPTYGLYKVISEN